MSRRRQFPISPSILLGTQDQFSGHITRPAVMNDVSSHGSTTQTAPFAALRFIGWGRQVLKQAGSVPSVEVELAGVASRVQLLAHGPGLAQLEDCDRGLLDGLQRAPISAGVRVKRTIARRAMGFAKNLPPPDFGWEYETFRHLDLDFHQANAWVC